MSVEDNHSGIPTRAIHEAYLDMQRALKSYREARDGQHPDNLGTSHGAIQQSVLTFYELLRPHLKSESAVKEWWHGEPPSYNHDGSPPEPDDGKGILQVQTKRDTYPLSQMNGQAPDPEQLETLADWHNALGCGDDVRIVGIAGEGEIVLVTVHQYQMGLKHMDNWETSYKRTVVQKNGFMEDKTETRIERQRIPIDRLRRAARELSEVANKLGALSDFDASEPRTEIPKELIEDVEEWRQANIE